MDSQVEVIGEGGFGTVFRLMNYNPPIVMKIARNEKVDEQQKELCILKELIHTNIVKYLDRPWDFEYQGNGSPIFMEYCEWGSLRDVIENPQIKYSVATIVKWGREIFSALVYLTQKRIVHHDLKLDNIFMAKDFVAKIGDFGVMKRFGNDEIAGGLLGTWLYIAPEYRDGQELDEEDLYKCDTFGAGLALLELIERRNLTTRLETVNFTPSKCPNVIRLQELIKRCSCPSIPIKKRCNVSDALDEIEYLETLFTKLDVEPEIQRSLTKLCKPDGLCLIETGFTDNFSPPDVTLSTGSQTRNAPAVNDRPKNSSHSDRFTYEFLPRIQRKTEFSHLWINDGTPVNHNKSSTLNFRLNHKEAMNVNEAREIISKNLLSRFSQTTPDRQRSLIEKMEELQSLYFKEDPFLESPVYFDDEWMELEFESDIWKELLTHWRRLIVFDLRLQHFSMYFSFHALYHCSSLQFSWVERLKLLDLAIHNIEEVEKIFTKRIRYRFRTFDDFSTEWCLQEKLAFKKDLSDFRFNLQDLDKGPFEKRTIIDLEAVRRALHLKRDASIKSSRNESKSKPETLQKYLNRMNEKVSSYRNQLKPESYVDPEPDLPPPGDYFEDFPAGEHEILQEALTFEDSQFPGYVVHFDALNIRELFPKCECSPECNVERFPEKAPLKGLQLEYSTCPLMNQREFLETHSLFERSFRVLHFWKEIFSHQYTLFILLIELLEEMETKKDPSFGFSFMFMRERCWQNHMLSVQKYVGLRPRPGDFLKRGLLISFDDEERNSFVNWDFKLEPALQDTFWLEYIGLIYIDLNDITKLLKIMMRYVRKYQRYKSRIEFLGNRRYEERYVEKLEMAYREKMQEAVGTFWMTKEEELNSKINQSKKLEQESKSKSSQKGNSQRSPIINESSKSEMNDGEKPNQVRLLQLNPTRPASPSPSEDSDSE